MSTIQEIVINKDGLDLLFLPGQIGKSEDMRKKIIYVKVFGTKL
jgi:hypothetical protein